MAIISLSAEEFLHPAQKAPILDVRSPSEYIQAHIPNARSFPLFNDEERKVVGTAYKQVSRKDAIKAGFDFFGLKMRTLVEQAEAIEQALSSKEKTHSPSCFRIHCWRGGMRSAAVAWLLDFYGFDVYVLQDGYKAFRKWVLGQFHKNYPISLIGGYTGSGKTELLHALEKKGERIIDLEKIAHHKGSAFGGLNRPTQPSTEMFENMLAIQLSYFMQQDPTTTIWVEDESQRIGNLNMPSTLWQTFRTKPLYFLEVPFEQRLHYLIHQYGRYSKESLINAVVRIRKRLGGLDTKNAIQALLEDNLPVCFEILLKYYDKQYKKALYNRPYLDRVMRTVPASGTDVEKNLDALLTQMTK